MANTDVFGSSAVAAGLISLTVWQSYEAYQTAAPAWHDLHKSGNDLELLQELVDADVMVGIVTFTAAAGASWLMKSWVPLILATVAFGLMVGYAHDLYNDNRSPLTTGR